MSSQGQQAQVPGFTSRVVPVSGGALLALVTVLTAALYDRLPSVIAVHWSPTGVADNPGDRSTAWLLPMVLGFMVALGLVARRHTKPSEQGLLAGVTLLAALYMFSLSMLLLFANIDNDGWQQGSVTGRWMLLVLTAPALVFTAGLYAYRARARAR